MLDKIAKVSKAWFECATTAGFADYREMMCALNNSLGPKKRLNEDTLTANYESALNRAGLQNCSACARATPTVASAAGAWSTTRRSTRYSV